MKILALDPGERVGWARADVDEDGEWSEFRHGITPLRDMALSVHAALNVAHIADQGVEPQYDVVVIEDWRLYPHMARQMIGSAFPSVQFIGAVKLACWLSATKLVTQGAGVVNSNEGLSNAEKSMKALRPELFELVSRPVKHDDGHDQDAIKHLWVYTFRNTSIGPVPERQGVTA